MRQSFASKNKIIMSISSQYLNIHRNICSSTYFYLHRTAIYAVLMAMPDLSDWYSRDNYYQLHSRVYSVINERLGAAI